MNKREFLQKGALSTLGLGAFALAAPEANAVEPISDFDKETFELSLGLNDLTKILNKLISNDTNPYLWYSIKFYMKNNKYFCNLIMVEFKLIDPEEASKLPFSRWPEEHVFSEYSDNSFEDALCLSMKKLNKDLIQSI